MLRRVNREEFAHEIRDPLDPREAAAAAITPVLDVELDTPLLPRDHPQWAKDALTISNRARELIARLKPVVVKILTFWDHRIRSTLVGNARVSIDPSGSYRVE